MIENTRSHNRIQKLDLKIDHKDETEPLFIRRVFVTPGELNPPQKEIQRIHACTRIGQVREWLRTDGESVDEFKSRVVQVSRHDCGIEYPIFHVFSE